MSNKPEQRKIPSNGLSKVFLAGTLAPRLDDQIRTFKVVSSFVAGRAVKKFETSLQILVNEDEERDVFNVSEGDYVILIGSLVSNPHDERGTTCIKPSTIEKIDTKSPKGVNTFMANVVTTMTPEVYKDGEYDPLVNIPAVINEYTGSTWVSLAIPCKREHQTKMDMLAKMKPGTPLSVEGRLKVSTDKNGKQHVKLWVKKFVFVHVPKDGASTASGMADSRSDQKRGKPQRSGPLPPRVSHTEEVEYDEDIPF